MLWVLRMEVTICVLLWCEASLTQEELVCECCESKESFWVTVKYWLTNMSRLCVLWVSRILVSIALIVILDVLSRKENILMCKWVLRVLRMGATVCVFIVRWGFLNSIGSILTNMPIGVWVLWVLRIWSELHLIVSN